MSAPQIPVLGGVSTFCRFCGEGADGRPTWSTIRACWRRQQCLDFYTRKPAQGRAQLPATADVHAEFAGLSVGILETQVLRQMDPLHPPSPDGSFGLVGDLACVAACPALSPLGSPCRCVLLWRLPLRGGASSTADCLYVGYCQFVQYTDFRQYKWSGGN